MTQQRRQIYPKVEIKENNISYGRVGKIDDLLILRIGDALFKTNDKTVEFIVLFLANKEITKASPFH